MVRGVKTVLAIKLVLDFVQPHLCGSANATYEDNGAAGTLTGNLHGSYRSKHIMCGFTICGGLSSCSG